LSLLITGASSTDAPTESPTLPPTAAAVTGCFTATPTEMPFCSQYVNYELPLSIKADLEGRDEEAMRLVDEAGGIAVCKEFFGLPAFQCFKQFPGCKADGTPKLFCSSVCKTAYDHEFAACSGPGVGFGEAGFTANCVCPASTPDCDAATYFTSTDTDCNDHYEALFPALRTGTGVYIGVAFVIGIVVFICGLLLCARRRTDDFESSALQVASRTDNLDADDSDEEGDKRVYKKEDLVKKRNRIIKNYGQVGGLLALHSLALLSMAIVTPYWTSDTLGKFDTTNYENATVEFQYGLWDFTAYGGSDLLHEQIVSEHGTGTWGTHCNHTRFVDNPSLLPSGFCDWQGDSLKYVTITCASMSAVMVLMLLVNYPIQAYSQIGSYLSALQAIGSMFVVIMWPFTMQDFYASEQAMHSRDMRSIGGAFDAPATAQLGDSYYLVCASFVFSILQTYFFHVCYAWVQRDPSLFGDDGKLKIRESYCGPVTVLIWPVCPWVCFCPVDKRFVDAPAVKSPAQLGVSVKVPKGMGPGGQVSIQTPVGEQTITIPPGVRAGQTFRVNFGPAKQAHGNGNNGNGNGNGGAGSRGVVNQQPQQAQPRAQQQQPAHEWQRTTSKSQMNAGHEQKQVSGMI